MRSLNIPFWRRRNRIFELQNTSMKKHLLLLTALITLFGCNQPKQNDSCALTKDVAEQLMQTDKDFNDYCTKNGQSAAFIKYADSNAIGLGEGSLPKRGIKEIAASEHRHDSIFAAKHLTPKLTWAPEKAEGCGEIGYTFGWWKYATKTAAGTDTVYQGVYSTVWKKQKDGSWKYVLDGGNDTPAPTK